MAVSLEKRGRRYYLRGTPFSAKDTLKEAGCRWDPAERAWWTGKRDTADDLLARLATDDQIATSSPPAETLDPNAQIIRGRVRYKRKSRYLLAMRRDGDGCKLAFRDGSRTFWTSKGTPFEVEARYREPRSLSGLRAYAERKKEEFQEYGYNPVLGRDYCGYPCPVAGHICTPDDPCHDCI